MPAKLGVALAVALIASACGTPDPNGNEDAESSVRITRCVAAPEGAVARREAVDDVGRRAWEAMLAADPARLLLDDLALRRVVDPESATRITARRGTVSQRIGDTADYPSLLDRAEYAGVCLQGARDEPAGAALGLLQDGWTFERLLVIGRQANGRRTAAWIEGRFVQTDAGFYALDLERVERPRWEHSDLEIAPCDLAIRDDQP